MSMENFISTVIFILPGFLMYFFIQSFGVNPVNKHNTGEIASFSAILWFPVSYGSLAILNLFLPEPIWTIAAIKNSSQDLEFLLSFFGISILTSFILSVLYSLFLYPVQRALTNVIRSWRELAPLSESASVWDEVFAVNLPQVVSISKIDKQSEYFIGELEKVPRPFEVEKSLTLRHVDLFTELIESNDVPVSRIFIDTKSGISIKIYDSDTLSELLKKDSVTRNE